MSAAPAHFTNIASGVVAFPGDMRPHRRPTKARVSRAKREGEAINLTRERAVREAESAPALPTISRSPELAIVLAMYKRLPADEQRNVRALCYDYAEARRPGWEHFCSAWSFLAVESVPG